MSLSVLVKSASNLPNVERFRKSDPMCVIILQGIIIIIRELLTLSRSFPAHVGRTQTRSRAWLL